MERKGARLITTKLAMQWAMQPQGVQHEVYCQRKTLFS